MRATGRDNRGGARPAVVQTNAVGDMVSSLYVGTLLSAGHGSTASVEDQQVDASPLSTSQALQSKYTPRPMSTAPEARSTQRSHAALRSCAAIPPAVTPTTNSGMPLPKP